MCFYKRRGIVEYKEKIIEIINEMERKDILRFIYIVISDILKNERGDKK